MLYEEVMEEVEGEEVEPTPDGRSASLCLHPLVGLAERE